MPRISNIISSFLVAGGNSILWYWATANLNKNTWSDLEIILVTIIFPIITFFMFFFTLIRFNSKGGSNG